jgi:Universal stress protein family
MMCTGLTFGTISALFGLNHGVITQAQYSYLVATVIGSAVIPTMIANAWFMPRHLLATKKTEETSTLSQAVSEEANWGGSMTGKRHNPHFRKLLVGYDGSPQSEKAVDIAFSLAECLDATVLIFAIARPPEPATSVE